MSDLKFTDDWIQTVDLWRWKRPLYQLSHNHCPALNMVTSWWLYLLLAAESFAGRFSQRLTVTMRAFLSKLYLMLQCKVPNTKFSSSWRVHNISYKILNSAKIKMKNEGRGGGQVVSMLTFHADDLSSNSADAYSFFCEICVWKEQK